MALAATTDLANRGIDTSQTERVEAFLTAATAAVQDAAGGPIAGDDVTITVPSVQSEWLRVPGGVLREVQSVTLDSEPVTDYQVSGNSLYRYWGWGRPGSSVEVECSIGLSKVPEDIVDLVCSLVGLALAEAEDGYAARGDLSYDAISMDDYSRQRTYSASKGGQSSPFEIPPATRRWLRARFGGATW